MATMNAKSALYKLGRLVFSVQACDEEFVRDLDRLLPNHAVPAADHEVLELNTGCTQDMRALLNHILKKHRGALWIDAGCLISPAGKLVLIAGRSSSGKSTLTMALALKYGWKVLAEDILLIDWQNKRVMSFASPFSLKSGTRALLRDSIGLEIGEPILKEWIPLGALAAKDEVDARFDCAIILDYADEPIAVQSIHEAEYLRRLLSISNVLRLNGGSDAVLEMLDGAACLSIVGGTLPERLDTIFAHCS
jgi:hypothetical protein